jgi:hypothetical protein
VIIFSALWHKSTKTYANADLRLSRAIKIERRKEKK